MYPDPENTTLRMRRTIGTVKSFEIWSVQDGGANKGEFHHSFENYYIECTAGTFHYVSGSTSHTDYCLQLFTILVRHCKMRYNTVICTTKSVFCGTIVHFAHTF